MHHGRSSELSEREVHVWTLRTAASSDVIATCEQVLAPDETRRAARFRFGHLRESFIWTRGALRHLIGRYIGRSPASIQFQYSSNGKPALTPDSGLRFNVTHSGDLAAIALTIGCDIGVDLEQLRPLPELEQIAARFFCPEEVAEIHSLPRDDKERAFFTCWTRKEAYIKAVGGGLSVPLDSFRVTVKPDTPAGVTFPDQEATASKSWTLHNLQLAPDYAGAIAYGDRERPLSIFPIIDPEELLIRRP